MAVLDIPSDMRQVERSALGNRWEVRAQDGRTVLSLCQKHSLPDIIGRILAGRGVDADGAEAFLNPSLRELMPDPSCLKDVDVAAERIAAAVISNETIGIFGDYDVDGATSTALLVRYFSQLGVTTHVHIPDRQKEGYGPNTLAMLGLKEKGATVILTVDCGTLAYEPLLAAHVAGLDVIVVDHHAGEPQLPKAYAVVNPNRFDEGQNCTQLAAVGVTFLVCVAVNRLLRQRDFFACRAEPDLRSLLDLVALGTVCDVVPLTGLNRAFVTQGIRVLVQRGNLGLRTLMDVAGLNEKPGVYHLGYVLGPRINAGGRVGEAGMGVRLLTTQDEAEALVLARQLSHYNEERKAIEAVVLEEAIAQVELRLAISDLPPVLVVHAHNWHPGVIGIIAGRLKEQYQRPAAVIAFQNGIGKASARSIAGVDFGAAVIAARQAGLLEAGGGHAMAAGFTVTEDKLETFTQFLQERMAPDVERSQQGKALSLDGWMALSGITHELVQQLEQIGPFGAGNPGIRIAIPNVRIVRMDIFGGQHLRLIVSESGLGNSGAKLKVMAFRAIGTKLEGAIANAQGKEIHMAGQLKLNYWQGSEQVEFTLDDLAIA